MVNNAREFALRLVEIAPRQAIFRSRRTGKPTVVNVEQYADPDVFASLCRRRDILANSIACPLPGSTQEELTAWECELSMVKILIDHIAIVV